mgnify:CR=1 FL=1
MPTSAVGRHKIQRQHDHEPQQIAHEEAVQGQPKIRDLQRTHQRLQALRHALDEFKHMCRARRGDGGKPPTHIPTTQDCDSCHVATAWTPATFSHAGITSGCSSCHESSFVWMGMSAYPIAPTVKTTGAQYTGFQTRPRAAAGTFNVADASHPATGDCSQCHSGTNFFSGQDKPANHIPYAATATCTSCHKNADYAVMPSITSSRFLTREGWISSVYAE